MSFDPFAPGSDVPSEYGAAPQPSVDPSHVRQRVQAPAIVLIVVGILNLLGIGWNFFNVATMTLTPANRLHEQLRDMYQSFPEIQAELNKKSPSELKNLILFAGWGGVTLGLVITVLSLAGGIRMLSLKNYALSIAGAISAAIPCVSCGGACCFGEIIGIWALVVLLNPDVKAAFR